MNKPKKKEFNKSPAFGTTRVEGYNLACDEWEEYLPNEDELLEYMINLIPIKNDYQILLTMNEFKMLAKSIHQRIIGGTK